MVHSRFFIVAFKILLNIKNVPYIKKGINSFFIELVNGVKVGSKKCSYGNKKQFPEGHLWSFEIRKNKILSK